MTPSPFPRWLCVLFPRLRAAETNGIYQAFRERRLHHHHSFVIDQTSVYALMFLIFPTVFFISAWLNENAVGQWRYTFRTVLFVSGILAVFSGIGLAWHLLFPRMRGASSRLPMWFSGVWRPTDVLVDQAVDIWMCGIGAREMAACIYLEHWERFHPWMRRLALFLLPAGPVLTAHWMQWEGGAAYILAAGMAVLAAGVMLFLLGCCEMFATAMVDFRDDVVTKGVSPRVFYLRGLVLVPVILVIGAVLVLGFLLVVRICIHLSPGGFSPAELRADWPNVLLLQCLLAVSAASLGLALRSVAGFLLRLSEKGIERHYAPFLRKISQEDPDWNAPDPPSPPLTGAAAGGTLGRA